MYIHIENLSYNFIDKCRKSQTNLKDIPEKVPGYSEKEQFIMSTYNNSIDLIGDIRSLGVTYIIKQIESDSYVYDFGRRQEFLFFDYPDEYDDPEEKERELRKLVSIYDHMKEVDINIIVDRIN